MRCPGVTISTSRPVRRRIPPADQPDASDALGSEAAGGPGPMVVVAGLPGAGKTTVLEALASLDADRELVVLDSAVVRRWLRAWCRPVPYPLLRPVVHAVHWARVAALACLGRRPLVIHETATRPLARRALRVLARCGRRRAVLVWIEVPADVARHGQVVRGRVVRRRAFARHVRWIRREHPARSATGAWDAVHRTDREGALAVVAAACRVSGR